jgi:hypothetical protein
MNDERNIVQIIPANGWSAVYAIRPDRNYNDPVWVSPLACWALVQEGTDHYVIGLDRTLSLCEAGDNFLGYLAPGENSKGWEEAALRNLRDPGRNTVRKRHAATVSPLRKIA